MPWTPSELPLLSPECNVIVIVVETSTTTLHVFDVEICVQFVLLFGFDLDGVCFWKLEACWS